VGGGLGAAVDDVQHLEGRRQPDGRRSVLVDAATTGEPGALLRGGSRNDGTDAGPLSVVGFVAGSNANGNTGFRCAR